MSFHIHPTPLRPTVMVTVGAMVLAALAVPASASAQSGDVPRASVASITDSLANVESIDPLLIQEPSSSAFGTTPLNSGEVTVPTSLADGVTMTDATGHRLRVDLPHSASAAPAALLNDGTVAYPGKSSANSIVVSNIGVQMLTTIVSTDAPVDYSYDVTLHEGQTLSLLGDGAAIIDADGGIAFAIGSAWAMDSAGKRIPTSYTVAGSTLTQHVDHRASSATAYPVVADPVWLAPAALRCLAGIGLNGPQIANILATGSPGSLGAAAWRAALACIKGR